MTFAAGARRASSSMTRVSHAVAASSSTTSMCGSAAELSAELHRPVDVVVTLSPRNELKAHFQALLFGPAPLPIVSLSVDGSCIDVYGRSRTRAVGIDGLTRLIREAAASAQ